MKLNKKHNHDHQQQRDSEAVSDNFHELADENGPIWVNKFNEDSARAFVKQLQYQSRLDPTGPIVVYIDSFGGDAYALLTMIAALEQIPNQIITCAMSKAMSAGAILLACGDTRFASEHSTLMIHEISAGTGGHIDDINVQHTNITKLNDKLMKLLVKKTAFKGGVSALKKLLANARDLYLDPEEAIKLGFIDHIGVPMLHKNLSVQYLLSSNPRKVQDDQESTVKKPKV
jgi:ATP-dependent Clp protease protease subunit